MEHRKEKRFISYAKVILVGKESPGYLRDLNSLGCQIDFVEPPSIDEGDQIEVRIIPNEELNLPDIQLILTIRWMKHDAIYYSIGGAFSEVPDEHNEAYQELLTYFRG